MGEILERCQIQVAKDMNIFRTKISKKTILDRWYFILFPPEYWCSCTASMLASSVWILLDRNVVKVQRPQPMGPCRMVWFLATFLARHSGALPEAGLHHITIEFTFLDIFWSDANSNGFCKVRIGAYRCRQFVVQPSSNLFLYDASEVPLQRTGKTISW